MWRGRFALRGFGVGRILEAFNSRPLIPPDDSHCQAPAWPEAHSTARYFVRSVQIRDAKRYLTPLMCCGAVSAQVGNTLFKF